MLIDVEFHCAWAACLRANVFVCASINDSKLHLVRRKIHWAEWMKIGECLSGRWVDECSWVMFNRFQSRAIMVRALPIAGNCMCRYIHRLYQYNEIVILLVLVMGKTSIESGNKRNAQMRRSPIQTSTCNWIATQKVALSLSRTFTLPFLPPSLPSLYPCVGQRYTYREKNLTKQKEL